MTRRSPYPSQVGASCNRKPNRVQVVAAFVRLSRFEFLLGGVLGVALGAAIAHYERFAIDLRTYVLVQTMVTAFHLMTHYSNDYFDRASDARTERTEFSGGSGALVDGTLAPRVALIAALVCALAGGALVAWFAARGDTVLALLGGLIALLAWSYSSPPLRLLATGFGEIATAIVVGMLVPLAGYVAFAHAIDARAFATTLPLAAAMFAMMIGVEWPDRAADAATGKRNLIVRFGSPAASRYAATACATIAVAGLLSLSAGAPPTVALAALAALVPGGFFVRSLDVAEPAEVAARGVTVFLTTAVFLGLGYCSLFA